MPLYEYLCSNCAHRFERIVKFSDAPLTTCPKCHKDTIEQLISAPAVQFKGSGWYVTDYAHKNSAGSSSPAKSDGGSESASPSNGGSTSDASSNSPSAPGSSDKASSTGPSNSGSSEAPGGGSSSASSSSSAGDSR